MKISVLFFFHEFTITFCNSSERVLLSMSAPMASNLVIGPDGHILHSYHYLSLFCHHLNHVLINPVGLEGLSHPSETAETLQLRNCQYKSKLKMYLQPEHNRTN